MKVKDYLQGASPKHFFIFDSHQEAMEECGVKHGDQDYRIYTYNVTIQDPVIQR